MKLTILLASLAALAVVAGRYLAVGRKPEPSMPQQVRAMLKQAEIDEQRLRDRFEGMATR